MKKSWPSFSSVVVKMSTRLRPSHLFEGLQYPPISQGLGLEFVEPMSHQYPGVQSVQKIEFPKLYFPTGQMAGSDAGSRQENPREGRECGVELVLY